MYTAHHARSAPQYPQRVEYTFSDCAGNKWMCWAPTCALNLSSVWSTIVRAKFPERTQDLPDEGFVRWCKTVEKAESYGIEYEDDIRRFIKISGDLWSSVQYREETWWIGDILRRNEYDGAAGINTLTTVNCRR